MNMLNYNVAIIGAGQLGSRHLQALKGSASPMNLYVIDNNEDSLKVAKERYDSSPISVNKVIKYDLLIENLPKDLDFVIVASGSKPRASIVKSLLERSVVRNLVLEKFLFPKLADYDEIGRLLHHNNVNCWVNCPRRMYGMYQSIKNRIDIDQPSSMYVYGNDWGLCCNAIHMIDIFMYLVGEERYYVETCNLKEEVVESKRSGYIEFYGIIRIRTPKGNTLEMKCEVNGVENKKEIVNGINTIEIDEVNGFWRYRETEFKYKVPYQSQLTGVLADMILITGYSPLTPYDLSCNFHKPFLAAVLNHYNKIKGDNSDLCPIT